MSLSFQVYNFFLVWHIFFILGYLYSVLRATHVTNFMNTTTFPLWTFWTFSCWLTRTFYLGVGRKSSGKCRLCSQIQALICLKTNVFMHVLQLKTYLDIIRRRQMSELVELDINHTAALSNTVCVMSYWAHVWMEPVIVQRIHGERVGVVMTFLSRNQKITKCYYLCSLWFASCSLYPDAAHHRDQTEYMHHASCCVLHVWKGNCGDNLTLPTPRLAEDLPVHLSTGLVSSSDSTLKWFHY